MALVPTNQRMKSNLEKEVESTGRLAIVVTAMEFCWLAPFAGTIHSTNEVC